MTKSLPFDAAECLDSREAIAAYLSEAFQTADPAFIAEAIGVVARAEGMTKIAAEAELSRESLYRSLGKEGHAEFGTIVRVLKAMGFTIEVRA